MKYTRRTSTFRAPSSKGGFSYFSLGGVCKNFRGVLMIMCRGGSRVFDDWFTRFTQLIGGPGACPPGKILKFGALKQHFLRSGVTFEINLMIRKCMFLSEFFTNTQLKQ
jgi:hypothetical protein